MARDSFMFEPQEIAAPATPTGLQVIRLAGPNLQIRWIAAPTHAINGQLLGDDHPDSKALVALALSPTNIKKRAWFDPWTR